MNYEKLYKHNQTDYIRKIQEELAELSCAVSHYYDDKVTKIDVLEELADVIIQIEKIIAVLSNFDKETEIIDRAMLEFFYDKKIKKLKEITKKL